MRWLGSLVVFVLVLVGLQFVLGVPISIAGSLVVTIILNVVFNLFSRR